MTTELHRMVRWYQRQGWAPVPVPAGEKNPGFPGWETYRASDDLARFNANVGLLLGEPSGGLVDVDLDSPEAQRLATTFLPGTGLRHGRGAKPNSHWWYVCDPIPTTRRYIDIDRTCIVEIRSTGGQTVVPPSSYRSNGAADTLVWEAHDAPAQVDGRVLADAVARIAACTLLARNWTTQGSKHDIGLAIAGALLRHGWDVEAALAFVRAASRLAGHTKPWDREAAVRDTAEALRRGRPATGIPTLADLLGSRVVDKLTDWLGIGPATEPPPPQITLVPAPLPEPDERAWSELLDETPLPDPDELPYFAERWTSHLAPFLPMFPDGDWGLMVGWLPFWSILWPEVRLQNLNLAVWSLGLSPQGVGKNVSTDESERIVRAVSGRLRREWVIYTAGSPEGMWDRLGGIGRQMLCYHDEYAGFLKLLQRDHMSHAREALCSLYDGRVVGYVRAQKGGQTIVDPLVAVAATTTPAAIRAHASYQDMVNGYISRFLVCAPNPVSVSPDYYPSDTPQREQLVIDVADHLYKLRDVRRLEWAETGRQDPPRINEYREHLGMNSGAVIDLDNTQEDATVPPGRLVARVKKVAGLLALAERRPERSTDPAVVFVGQQHVETALKVVERGHAYALRMQQWVGVSSEYEASKRILRHLHMSGGATQRELCRITHLRAGDVRTALDLLESAGLAVPTKTGRTIVWRAA